MVMRFLPITISSHHRRYCMTSIRDRLLQQARSVQQNAMAAAQNGQSLQAVQVDMSALPAPVPTPAPAPAPAPQLVQYQQPVPQQSQTQQPQPQQPYQQLNMLADPTPSITETHPRIASATDMQLRDLAEISLAILGVTQCPAGRMILEGKFCPRCGLDFNKAVAIAAQHQAPNQAIGLGQEEFLAMFCGEPEPHVEQALTNYSNRLPDAEIDRINSALSQAEG